MSPKLKLLLLLVAALLLGGTAFTLTQRSCCDQDTDEIVWMTKEFRLTENQASEIKQRRDAYDLVCAKHCAAIARAEKQVKHFEATGDKSSEAYRAAEAEYLRVSQVCVEATRNHVREIASLMGPEDGKRYLELVLPKISQGNSSSACLTK